MYKVRRHVSLYRCRFNENEPSNEDKSPNKKGDKMKKEIAETRKEAEFLASYPKRFYPNQDDQEESLKRKSPRKFEGVKKKHFDDQFAEQKIEESDSKSVSKCIPEAKHTLPPLSQDNSNFAPSIYASMHNTYMERQLLEKKLNIWLFNLKIQECFIIRALLQLQQQGNQLIAN